MPLTFLVMHMYMVGRQFNIVTGILRKQSFLECGLLTINVLLPGNGIGVRENERSGLPATAAHYQSERMSNTQRNSVKYQDFVPVLHEGQN